MPEKLFNVLRIGKFEILANNIAHIGYTDSYQHAIVCLLYPIDGQQSIEIEGEDAEILLNWMDQNTQYHDLRPGHQEEPDA